MYPWIYTQTHVQDVDVGCVQYCTDWAKEEPLNTQNETNALALHVTENTLSTLWLTNVSPANTPFHYHSTVVYDINGIVIGHL
jgi:hypothetical protein